MPHVNPRSVGKGQYLTLLGTFLVSSILSGVLLAGLVVPAAGVAGITVKAAPRVFDTLPTEFDILAPSEISTITTADGKVLAKFYAENRVIVAFDQISDNMKNAILAIEDKRFYEHKGIDPEGMARAAVHNLKSEGTQGGSTLTQQYVKNTLLETGLQKGDQDLIESATEQTISRKLREARYALALEQKMSKDDILLGYLNIAPFGTNVYGVEAASQLYFSHSAAELTVAESALLAGVVKSPAAYDPTHNPEEAKERRNTVLGTMLAQKKITQEEYDEAVGLEIEDMLNVSTATSGCAAAGNAAYFCDYVIASLMASEDFGKDEAERKQKLLRGGLTIRTTLNSTMQEYAYEAAIDRVPIDDPSGANTAIVSRDPKTGYILAMAQNTRYGLPSEDDTRATQTSFNVDKAHGGGDGFQGGSALKPFTLLQWFKEGHTAWERVGGHSTQFQAREWNIPCSPGHAGNWTVGEAARREGSFSVLQATELSVNRAFAHMASQVNLCGIFEGMKALGITQPDGSMIEPYPAEIIGAGATPLTMAGAYGAFANEGVLCEPMSVISVTDRDGEISNEFEPSCHQAVDKEAAMKVTAVLRRNGDSAGYSNVRIGRPIIAKTGTTDKNDNLWLVGGTPQVITAAWAGYGHASTTSVAYQTINGVYYGALYGGTFSGPMWAQYMRNAMADYPVESFNEGNLGSPPPPPRPSPEESTDRGDHEDDDD